MIVYVTNPTDKSYSTKYLPIRETAIAVVRVRVVAVARSIDIMHIVRIVQIRRPLQMHSIILNWIFSFLILFHRKISSLESVLLALSYSAHHCH